MAKLQAPVMLVILDGFGMGDQTDTTNAVVQAKPSYFNYLWDTYPHTTLQIALLRKGKHTSKLSQPKRSHQTTLPKHTPRQK